MNTAKQPLLDFRTDGPIAVGTIRASSVLSAINVAEFGSEVLAYIKAHPRVNLLLNFENVDYLSSAVLTELLRINKAIQETGGRLHLCSVSATIREIFEITNLDRIFVINGDSVDAAVRKFKRSIEIAAAEAAWKEPAEPA
ncbi:MAG: STAS domain-containing protein [Candidatus Hydrogenedentes bacterium]|nr:STAS domain-containing protein [Candidatus Hydrogenedentota bacterium]